MPGHFQLEKSLGFQGGASLQLPKKCHHVFLAKFPVCEESSCTPQWSPDAFEAPAPRESTGPAWSWATGSWSLPEAGGRGHSWKKADWNVSLISLSGCVEKVWEQISTLHLQPGASWLWHHPEDLEGQHLESLSIFINSITAWQWKKLPPACSHPLPGERFRNPGFLCRIILFTQKIRKEWVAFLDQECQLLKQGAMDRWEQGLQRNSWFVQWTTSSTCRLVWDFLLWNTLGTPQGPLCKTPENNPKQTSYLSQWSFY